MPKVVDRTERRTELAEAVWRVIRRDGLEHASVRNVAREAGLSMGSLRHYFSTQSELLIFALRLVIERIDRRLATLHPDAEPRQAAERFLAELLPLDADRRAENEVWLAYTARAQVDPALRALQDEGYDLLRQACLRWTVALAAVGADHELEADRLFALLDGLAVHVAIRPDQASPDRVRAILARHLDELAAPGALAPRAASRFAWRRQTGTAGTSRRRLPDSPVDSKSTVDSALAARLIAAIAVRPTPDGSVCDTDASSVQRRGTTLGPVGRARPHRQHAVERNRPRPGASASVQPNERGQHGFAVVRPEQQPEHRRGRP